MKLKVFTKEDCPNCPAAKKIVKKAEAEGAKVEWYDLDEEEGLAEAVYFDVLATPAIIVTDDSGCEVKAWRGDVPELKTIQNELKQK